MSVVYSSTDPQFNDTQAITLQKILQAGVAGGGGGSSTDYNLKGVADPSAAPSDVTKVWHYTNTVIGSFWIWTGAAWQQIV